MSVPDFPFAARLVSMRAVMEEMGLDTFVVSHPPNVFYVSGFSGSAGALVVDKGMCGLVVDSRYITAARDLPRSHPALSTMQVFLAERSEDETILEILKSRPRQRIGIEAAWMPVLRFNRLSAALAAGEISTPLASRPPCPVLVPTERVVEQLRLIKDNVEVAVLREAAGRLSRAASHVVLELLRPGRTEAEVAAGIDAELRKAGFQRSAFETIVASGPNSALPHARPGPRVLQQSDAVVLDFGGVYDGYCVDLTRTVQLPPSTPEFRRLFAAVAEAHGAAIAAVRPGTLTTDIDLAARRALERHGLGEAFGHGTGHGLGLEVHEGPRISKADPARPAHPVSAGMVFTIEPGVYLPGIGGVRIEDDVLVADGACEVLTTVPIELHVHS